jgi:hypothetical protein
MDHADNLGATRHFESLLNGHLGWEHPSSIETAVASLEGGEVSGNRVYLGEPARAREIIMALPFDGTLDDGRSDVITADPTAPGGAGEGLLEGTIRAYLGWREQPPVYSYLDVDVEFRAVPYSVRGMSPYQRCLDSWNSR